MAGTWPDRVQLDGRAFRHVIETYAPNEMLQLLAYPDRLEIKSDRGSFSMSRLDRPGQKPIKTRPMPRDKRHKGPVKVVDQPPQGRVELHETWDFSARIPVPHHRFPDSELPPKADLSKQSTRTPNDVGHAADGRVEKTWDAHNENSGTGWGSSRASSPWGLAEMNSEPNRARASGDCQSVEISTRRIHKHLRVTSSREGA